jgi:hypothetical protein
MAVHNRSCSRIDTHHCPALHRLAATPAKKKIPHEILDLEVRKSNAGKEIFSSL